MTIEQARDTLRRDYGVETAEEYRAAIEAARVRIRDAKRDIAVLDRCAQTVWSRGEWQTPALVDATDEGLDWRDRLALDREVLRTMREERAKRNRLRCEAGP